MQVLTGFFVVALFFAVALYIMQIGRGYLTPAFLRAWRGGVEYWRGRVWPGQCGEASNSEAGGAGVEAGHGGNPPKVARLRLHITHEGAKGVAHPRGALGPESFALRVQ